MTTPVEILVTAKDEASGVLGGIAKTFEGGFGGLIVASGAAATAAIAAVSAALVKGVSDATAWGNSLHEIQQHLGTTADQSAGLALMADRAGISSESATAAWEKFGKGLETAGGKAGTASKALDELGLSAYNNTYHYKTNTEVMGEVTDALEKMGKGAKKTKIEHMDFTDQVKALKLSFSDLTSSTMKDMPTLLQEVSDKLIKMPDGLAKDRLEMELFGRSGTQMADLLELAANGGVTDFKKQAKEMGLAIGQEEIDKIHNYELAQRKIEEQLKGVSVTIGTATLPIMITLGNVFEKVFNNQAVQAGIKSIAQGLATFIDSFSSSVGAGNDVFTSFLIGIFKLGETNPIFENLGKSIRSVKDWIADAIAWIQTNVAPAIDKVVQVISNIIGGVVKFISNNWNSILSTATLVWNLISGIITGQVEVIKSFVNHALSVIREWWDKNGADIAKTVLYWWAQLETIFMDATDLVKNIIDNALHEIALFWQYHGNQIKAILSAAWAIIQGIVQVALDIIKGIIKVFQDIVKGDWKKMWDDIGAIVSTVWNDIKTTAGKVWDAIKITLTTIWGEIKEAAENKWGEIKTWFSNTVHAISDFFTKTDWLKVGQGILEGIWNGILGAWDWLKGMIGNLLTNLWNSILAGLKAGVTGYTPGPPPGSGKSGGGGGNNGGGGGSGTHQKMASGGSFVIPPNFENDTYSLGFGNFASSGERVTVTPKGQGSGNIVFHIYGWNGDAKSMAREVDRQQKLKALMT